MIDAEGLRRSLIDLPYGIAGFVIGVVATIFARRISFR